MEAAPFAFGVYIGDELRIVLANKSIMDTWGKGTDIVGKTYTEVLPELEDQNILPQLLGVLRTGIPYHAHNQRVDLVVGGRVADLLF